METLKGIIFYYFKFKKFQRSDGKFYSYIEKGETTEVSKR